jgi:hypothetical protein
MGTAPPLAMATGIGDGEKVGSFSRQESLKNSRKYCHNKQPTPNGKTGE